MEELTQQWNKALQLLRQELTESAFRTWFAGIVPVQFQQNKLVLQVQSDMICEYIEENYIDKLGPVLQRVFGPMVSLEYRVMIDRVSGASTTTYSPALEQEKLIGVRPSATPQFMQRQPVEPELPRLDSRLNGSQTFESFVMGECNKMARSVALAISKDPGKTTFNPLFLYGGSGVGKTHLVNALGNMVLTLYPDKRVLYLSANDFKMQYMNASATNHLADFLGFYQTIDVLIIDDIQFISRMEKTQDAFFHIFNHLHQSGKQIVLTSDRSPLDIKDIQDRLITRFKWGFTGELRRPDFALRRDILRNKIYRDGVSLSDDIVNFIAEHVSNNVRDLEGVLASLLAYSTLSEEQISMELAEKVVSRIVDITPSALSIEDVVHMVAEELGVTEQVLLSTARTKDVAQARQVAMYLAKKLTNKPLQEIGAAFGGRTHATVLHAISIIEQQMAQNAVLKRMVNRLENQLMK